MMHDLSLSFWEWPLSNLILQGPYNVKSQFYKIAVCLSNMVIKLSFEDTRWTIMISQRHKIHLGNYFTMWADGEGKKWDSLFWQLLCWQKVHFIVQTCRVFVIYPVNKYHQYWNTIVFKRFFQKKNWKDLKRLLLLFHDYRFREIQIQHSPCFK